MKKFLLIMLLLVLLTVGGVVGMVAMSFNSSSYEKNVIQTLTKLTGRDVTIGGTTTITWMPVPVVTLHDMKVPNIDKGQEQTMLSIEKIKIVMDWASLFKSPLEIKSIEVTRPVLFLERTEGNRANFSFPFLLDPHFQLQEIDLMGGDSQKTMRIDNVSIKEGTVHYLNRITGVTFDISDIEGKLSVGSVRGPFTFKGTGSSNNGQYTLDLETGVFQGIEAIPLKFQLDEKNTQFTTSISGNLTPISTDKWYEGSGSFSIGKVKAFTTLLGIPEPESPNLQTAGGSLSLDIAPGSDSLKDFIIQFGEDKQRTTLTGTISRTLKEKTPIFKVDIGSDLVNLADWKPYLDKLNWDLLKTEEKPPVDFHVVINSIPYKKGNVQNLSLEGQYEKGVLEIKKSTVTLPGGALLTFSGIGKAVNNVPTLSINLRGEAESISPLVTWLKEKSALNNVAFLDQKTVLVSRFDMTPQQMALNINNLKIGTSDIKGYIQKTLGEKTSYDVNLAMRDVNLDALTGWKVAEQPTKLKDLPGVIKSSLERATWAEGLNIKGELDLLNGTVFGSAASRIHLKGQVSDNNLQIDTLSVQNWAKANMTLSAILDGVGRPQMNVDGLKLALETKQLPLLLEKGKVEPQLPLVRQATNASLKLNLKGGREDAWELSAQANLTDTSIKLNGILETLETNPTIRDFTFDVAHPNFQTFIKLVYPEFKWLPKLDGTFKASGKATGNAERLKLTDASLGIGLQQLSGTLSIDNGTIKTIQADIASPAVDVERFLSDISSIYTPSKGFSDQNLDLTALDKLNLNIHLNAAQLSYNNFNIRQADVLVLLQNKEFKLEKFTGMSGTSTQSPVSITGKFDWNTTPTLTADFDVKNIPLRSDFLLLSDFAFGGGILSATGEIKARGQTPIDFIRDLNGKGTMNIRGGQMMGTDIEKMIPIITRAIQKNEDGRSIEPDIKRVLHSGKTTLQSISGDYVITNGVIRMMDLTLDTQNAVANPTQIVWDIPKRTLDISIPVILKPLNTLPPFILGVSATVGRGTYRPNYTDLITTLSSQSRDILSQNMKQQEEASRAAALQKRTDRLAEAKKLTAEAREAVTRIEQKVAEFPFEKGQRILQSTRDALVMVNQLAVLEEPTDAQLIQQIEQARLILVQAEDFQKNLEKETFFNAQKKLEEYRNKGQQMTERLNTWAEKNPDIVVLVKLAENATQNHQIMETNAAMLTAETEPAEMQRILDLVADSVQKIEKAYQHARRFDLGDSDLPPLDGIDNQQVNGSGKAVRGSFKRSK